MAADAKLLAQIELVGDIDEWIVDAVCDPTCDAYRGPNGGGCSYCIAKFIADKLTDAGRLLPSGGEVSTQWLVLNVGGFWREGCPDEAAARDLFQRVCDINRGNGSTYEMRRRQVVTMPDGFKAKWPWEVIESHPVLSDNSEGESSA